MHSQVCWRLDAPGRSDEGHEGTSIALTHARVGCRSEVVINSDGQMLCLFLINTSLCCLFCIDAGAQVMCKSPKWWAANFTRPAKTVAANSRYDHKQHHE